jgi:OFA family oxalate/formate antiporter-like MFS transporter
MITKPKSFYYGWWVAAAAAGIEFANAATAIGILTIFVNPMSQEFGWNRTEVAGATSLGAILGATLAPFSGRLVDRLGSRMVLAFGGTVVVLGCLYLSTAQALLGFYVAFTLCRIADQGLIKIGASVTAGKWFLRYRGRATGLVFFAGSAGMIIMAPVVQLVITYWGWRAAWVVLAVVMFCVGVIPSTLIIRRQPEDMGLTIDGGTPAQSPTSEPAQNTEERFWPLSEVVKTPAFWLILISLFMVSTATSGIGLHLVPHLILQGLTPVAAVGAISIMSTAGAAGALAAGFAAERVSPKLLMTLIYLLGAVSIWVLIQADSLAETYLFAVLQGMVGSGVNTLAPIVWASYYGRRTLGSIFGLSRAAQVSGFAIGPLASAMVYDTSGTYRQAFISLSVVAVAASLLVMLARRPAARETDQLPKPMLE